MVVLSLAEKVDLNSFFSIILEKIQDDPHIAKYKIKNHQGLYTFIYHYVVGDIKLFLNNLKNELDESTKYFIQQLFNEIFKRFEKRKVSIEVLPLDKEFVIYYLNVLNTIKALFGKSTDNMCLIFDDDFVHDDQEAIEKEMDFQDEIFTTILLDIIGENAYDFIENMKNQKQNAIHKTELETIFNKRKLPEDIQKKILEFSYNEIIDGCK